MSRERELEAENAELQERVEAAERYTAETLLRATRLNQVISLLAQQGDLDAVIDRAAVELAPASSLGIHQWHLSVPRTPDPRH